MNRLKNTNAHESITCTWKVKAIISSFFAFVVSASCLTGVTTAHAGVCDDWNNADGWGCFSDYDSRIYGGVAGWNSRWSALPGNWDNRANFFINFGVTHNFRLHSGEGFTGAYRSLSRGEFMEWHGVSSNSWWR